MIKCDRLYLEVTSKYKDAQAKCAIFQPGQPTFASEASEESGQKRMCAIAFKFMITDVTYVGPRAVGLSLSHSCSCSAMGMLDMHMDVASHAYRR